MPVQVKELADSRRHNLSIEDASGEIKYICFRDADESIIYDAVAAAAPLLLNGLSFRSIDLDPQGGGVWYATVIYGLKVGSVIPSQDAGGGSSPPAPPPPPPAPPQKYDALGAEWAFDTTGVTKHITQSIETRHKVGAAGAMAPNFKGAIGVSKDTIEGVDIVGNRLELTTTRTIAALSLAYIQTVGSLTGTINDAPFWGYQEGELLFLGASGQFKSPEEGWVVTYRFLAGETKVLFVVNDDITLNDVGPHDYVWYAYGENTSEGRLIQKPIAAYVEQVYYADDFLKLKL